MCRLAAYAGPPTALSTLIYDAPHGLERQAYRPHSMVSGTINVDGTGIAWWPAPVDEPLVYVTERPPWSDPNLPRLAPRLTAGMQLAAVRSATPGMPAGPDAALPFVSGKFAFAHNGYLEGFDRGIGRRLLSSVPDDLVSGASVMTDSIALFLRFSAMRREDPIAPLLGALRRLSGEVADLYRDREGLKASLTLVAADGSTIAAVRTSVGVASNPIHVAYDTPRWPVAGLLASEPLDDDDGWSEVPHDHAAEWRDGAWQVTNLKESTGATVD